ncbi:iron complex transport system permease protein [Marininema mesophilum]|uniref:Iron complex transport system permease protein n=2 Tax=Marininema mesophilum TaxID=1048340 RepID=A0A1H2WEG9_9BACL|nr:iron complex transport system permease protein [Marininema mesophilum]
MIISVGLGEMNISPLDATRALFGIGNPSDEVIIYTLRLPRLLMALLVGASLAVSGAILQGVMRNPLSSPDVIGITGGASVVAVFLLTFLTDLATYWLPLASFVGGSLTALFIYSLAWKQGVSPLRIVLIGIGINAAANGLTTLLLILSPMYAVNQAMVWLTGSVYSSSWKTVTTFFPWALVLLSLSFVISRHLNAQQMGDEVATGIGHQVQRHRLIAVLVSVGLASSVVAFTGPIAFVGLMAPHIARMLTGPSYGRMLPIAALVGSFLVMSADLIARTAFSPLDLPAGLFTAALGAPFLIILLHRSGQKF